MATDVSTVMIDGNGLELMIIKIELIQLLLTIIIKYYNIKLSRNLIL